MSRANRADQIEKDFRDVASKGYIPTYVSNYKARQNHRSTPEIMAATEILGSYSPPPLLLLHFAPGESKRCAQINAENVVH